MKTLAKADGFGVSGMWDGAARGGEESPSRHRLPPAGRRGSAQPLHAEPTVPYPAPYVSSKALAAQDHMYVMLIWHLFIVLAVYRYLLFCDAKELFSVLDPVIIWFQGPRS